MVAVLHCVVQEESQECLLFRLISTQIPTTSTLGGPGFNQGIISYTVSVETSGLANTFFCLTDKKQSMCVPRHVNLDALLWELCWVHCIC